MLHVARCMLHVACCRLAAQALQVKSSWPDASQAENLLTGHHAWEHESERSELFRKAQLLVMMDAWEASPESGMRSGLVRAA